MNATGTKLLIVRAKKIKDRNGIVIPDNAQPESAYGLVLSVGPSIGEELRTQLAAIEEHSEDLAVVLFNRHQTIAPFIDYRGRLEIEALDQEVVLASMSREDAKDWFGCEFPEIPDDFPK